MITYIFRKRLPNVFSIEKIFDALYQRFDQTGESISRLELPAASSGLFSVLRNAVFVAVRRNSAVLHVTGDVHYAAILCPFAKTIITIHDCVVLQRGSGLKRWVLWVLWFWLPLRMATVVTVISEQTKRELLDTVAISKEKIVVVPNFISPDFEFKTRSFGGECPRVLHVGTTPNKNLHRVIEALRGISCVLVIVGPISMETLSLLNDAGIRHEHHVGIDHARLRELYWEADIISFPSMYEGFGMPILEGQASGRPVMTSDSEPMRSVAGEGGALLVDPRSVDSIRDGFRQLIDDDRLRARLVNAGRINCERFTLDAVAARYLGVYRQLAVSPARSSVVS